MDVDWTQPGLVQLTATVSPAIVQPAASQRSASSQPSTYTRPASVQPTSRPHQKCWTFNGPYCNLGDSVCKYPIPEWKNSTFVLNYRNNISSSLSNLKHIDHGYLNRQGAQNLVNKNSEDLIKIIHNAVLKSKTKSFSNKRRRKHWWDTSCTIARDKLKFWFSI